MINNKKLKYITIATLSFLLIIVSVIVINFIREEKKIKKHLFGTEDLEKRETVFKKKPNIRDAMFLMDKYHLLKDYEKALFYGKTCIKLGVNEMPEGPIVHFWIAEIYQKRKFEVLARTHLIKALALDTNNVILKNKWIEKSGLKKIYKEMAK